MTTQDDRSLASRARRAAPLVLIGALHLALAWPGAADRGVIAEEVQPYLPRYPLVLDGRDPARFHPPNDDPAVRAAVAEGGRLPPRWVGTPVWPEIGYLSEERVWPVFVRGHQTALGTYWGVALAPALGDGIAGVRRSSVLLGLVLVALAWILGRRLGLSRAWASGAALACVLAPGLWFFARTGYGFELASRVLMLLALAIAAPRAPLTIRRGVGIGLALAAAVLARATIAVTLAPMLALMLAHPRRYAGLGRAALPLAIGGGVPVLVVAVALALLPFGPDTTPAAHLPIDALAERTLTAPATLVAQLAWLVDARFILAPLVDGGREVSAGVVRPLMGGLVIALAFFRWWRGRAREPERLACVGLLANALFGAWLYGNPIQFQLGMALAPVFALAVAAQLADLAHERPRLAAASGAMLLAFVALTLGSLWRSEQRTDNPMLSGRAQRELAQRLGRAGVEGEQIVTTTYDSVGVIEAVSAGAIHPIHAYEALKQVGPSPVDLVQRWDRILEAHDVRRVVLTRAPSLVQGRFTDNEGVAAALDRALEARGMCAERRSIEGDGGGVVFELVSITPCGGER